MNVNVNKSNYVFEKFVPSKQEISVLEEIPGVSDNGVDALLSLARFSGDVEVVQQSPRTRFTVPPSIFGKTTSVRYAGEIPLVSLAPDRYNNTSIVLQGDCALEVTFYTPDNPGGRVKVVTTRPVIK